MISSLSIRNIVVAIICSFCVFSCSEEPKKKKNKETQGAMASSVGNINNLSVVIDNELWKGNLGDTIRKYFGAEVPGLPQEEPLFSMRQMPPQAFSGFATKNRTFLKIEKGGKANFVLFKNKFATPQRGAVFVGKTDDEIAEQIRIHAEEVIKIFKKTETLEKQKRIRKSLEKIPSLKEKFGITLDIPTAYRIAKEEDKFFWIRKDIQNGSANIMIYEMPLSTVKKDSNTISHIIKMRDSIGASKIPTDEGGKFITEMAYAPYLFETELDKRFAFETKGIWEIKNKYMSGPFVNYSIKDEKNNRLLVIEGFIFAPSIYKRNNMFELEAIIKSIKFR
ncbi:DUF4837 family protein [Aquimarina sp. TRL1]|uniref:DUF4837 family protein n=1 Tax=Aquimarina sp. (strain TRL1) TaxID=2736252 RepID=UPI00158D2A49|nr:DUF4837 family protein [Aquimarina sp. TRL1]QKX04701.1 DUF4837 family protein [Aquimarina sp. TRL1]